MKSLMRLLKIWYILIIAGTLTAGFFNRGLAQTAIFIYNNDPAQQACDTVPVGGYFNIHVTTSAPQPGDTVRVRVESDMDSGYEVVVRRSSVTGPPFEHHSDGPVRVWEPLSPPPPGFFCKNLIRAMPLGWIRVTAVELGINAVANVIPNVNPFPVFGTLMLSNGKINNPAVPISPDNDGDTDFLNISYSSNETGPSWVVIDTNRNSVFEITEDWAAPGDWTHPIWAEGGKNVMSFWDGRDQRTGQALPNGTYDILVYLESWATGQCNVDSFTLKVDLISGSCSGIVTDNFMNPVPDAKVQLGNSQCFGWARSGPAGNYAIYGLKPGTYHGHAEAVSHTPADTDGVVIDPGLPASADFILGGPGVFPVNVLLNPASTAGETLYGKVDVWSIDKPSGSGVGISFLNGEDYKSYNPVFAPGTYMMKASLPRYIPQLFGPVYVVTGANTGCTIVLGRAGAVYGTAVIPEPNATGNTIFIGVNARGQWTENRGFGGAMISPGSDNGIFAVFDLMPDTYALAAHCGGYTDAVINSVRVDTDAAGLIFNFS